MSEEYTHASAADISPAIALRARVFATSVMIKRGANSR